MDGVLERNNAAIADREALTRGRDKHVIYF